VPEVGLFIIGGFGASGAALATVERFDDSQQQWSTVAPMSSARANATAVVLQGRIYVIGTVLFSP
jgi:hypothetical protein